MNLLFSVNRAFVPLLTSCLRSVVQNGGMVHYDAYVLHSDLTEEDCAALSALYTEQVAFHFVPVDEHIFDGFPEFKRYPRQIYYRLAAPTLLPATLDRVLYLDVDTLVINSLEELYTKSFDGKWFMACTNINRLLTRVNQIRLGMEEDAPYINSGVMLLNLEVLREKFHLEDVRRYALEMKSRLVLPDQDIMTALCARHVVLLDNMRYNLSDRTLSLYNADPTNPRRDAEWVRENTVIIHYFGRNKPWKENYRGVLDVFWQENEAQ